MRFHNVGRTLTERRYRRPRKSLCFWLKSPKITLFSIAMSERFCSYDEDSTFPHNPCFQAVSRTISGVIQRVVNDKERPHGGHMPPGAEAFGSRVRNRIGSANKEGTDAGILPSTVQSISGDGRYVVFVSRAPDLVAQFG